MSLFFINNGTLELRLTLATKWKILFVFIIVYYSIFYKGIGNSEPLVIFEMHSMNLTLD